MVGVCSGTDIMTTDRVGARSRADGMDGGWFGALSGTDGVDRGQGRCAQLDDWHSKLNEEYGKQS